MNIIFHIYSNINMSNIRLRTITIEPSLDLRIKNGDTVFLSTSPSSLMTHGGVYILNTLDSTFITNGALTISGGLSVSKTTLMNGNLSLLNENSIFSLSGTSINRLKLNTSLFEFSPNGISNLVEMSNFSMSILSTTPSSNITTGALILSGGLTISQTTNSASVTNGGALTIMGGSFFKGKINCQDQVLFSAQVHTLGNIVLNNTNVGINVSSPNFPLDVNGNTNVSGRVISRVNAASFNSNFAAFPIANESEASIAFFNNTAGSVTSEGNVYVVGHNVFGSGNRTFGIGTQWNGSILTMYTSGTSRFNNNLEVVRSDTIPSLLISGGITGGNGATVRLLGAGQVGSSVQIDMSTYDPLINDPTSRIRAVDENFSSNLLFQTKTPGAATNTLTTRMFIANDGKIGINTTVPSHQLHVSGDVFISGGSTITNLLTTNISSSSIINTNSNITNISSTNAIITNASIQNISITNINSTTTTIGTLLNTNLINTNATITNSILTTSSIGTLLNTNASMGIMFVTNTSGIILNGADRPMITRGFDLFSSGNYSGAGRWGLFMEPGATTLGIPAGGVFRRHAFVSYNADSTINTTMMTIHENGNVGIGTNPGLVPSHRLTVSGGNVFISGGITVSSILCTESTINNILITNSTITNILNTNVSSSSVNVTGRAISRQNADNYNANFSALPTSNGNETAIAFFNNTAGNTNSAGQVWVVGHNVFGSGNGNFSIGTPSHGSILTMYTSGTSRFNNNLEVVRSGSIPSLLISGGVTGGNGATVRLVGAGQLGSSVQIDMSTYDTLTNDPTSRIRAVDEAFSSNLLFQTKVPGADTNSLATRMYINNDGKVGINTTSPTTQFHVNGSFLSTGQSTFSSTKNSQSTTSGAVIISGGLGVANNIYAGGDVNILGNLNVNGTTTFVNTTNIEIKDNLILLNSAPSGTSDSGMFVYRYQIANDSGLGDIVNDSTFTVQSLPSQSGLSQNEIRLDPSSSASTDFYKGWWIKITSGFSSNQVREITSYNGTTKVATISSNWTTQNPSGTDTINLYNKPYTGVIYNESSDNFEFISSNVRPTSASLNITDYVPIKASKLTITDSSSNSIISNGGIIFPNKNNVILNPNSDDILSTVSFTANQNQTLQTISNLSFSSDTWGFDVYLSARVIASQNLYGNYHIRGVNKGSSWVISYNLTGDNTGITFDITTSGQLTYTSPTYPSFSSLLFKYKSITN